MEETKSYVCKKNSYHLILYLGKPWCRLAEVSSIEPVFIPPTPRLPTNRFCCARMFMACGCRVFWNGNQHYHVFPALKDLHLKNATSFFENCSLKFGTFAGDHGFYSKKLGDYIAKSTWIVVALETSNCQCFFLVWSNKILTSDTSDSVKRASNYPTCGVCVDEWTFRICFLILAHW